MNYTSWTIAGWTGGDCKKFRDFEVLVRNKYMKTIKILRSDNGGEYLSSEFDQFLKSKGIEKQLTVPFTPQTAEWSSGEDESSISRVCSYYDDSCKSSKDVLGLCSVKCCIDKESMYIQCIGWKNCF